MVSSCCFRCCCLRVSVLGYTLEGDPAVQHVLLGTTLRHFPIIGPQLQQNISSIHGSRMGVILASTVPSTGAGCLGGPPQRLSRLGVAALCPPQPPALLAGGASGRRLAP